MTLKWALWLFFKLMYVVANIIEKFKNDSIEPIFYYYIECGR